LTENHYIVPWTVDDYSKLCMTEKDFEKFEYPLESKLSLGETLKDEIHCDRCGQIFEPKLYLTESDKIACTYHEGSATVQTLNGTGGTKEKIFRCCGNGLSSSGCQKGPHVFKETCVGKLHKRIPFNRLPERASGGEGNKILPVVGCDCEMSYTSGGMELTRVTFIDRFGNIILDELVIPTYPVVDLNTKCKEPYNSYLKIANKNGIII
jgi:RNA exonuclease 1